MRVDSEAVDQRSPVSCVEQAPIDADEEVGRLPTGGKLAGVDNVDDVHGVRVERSAGDLVGIALGNTGDGRVIYATEMNGEATSSPSAKGEYRWLQLPLICPLQKAPAQSRGPRISPTDSPARSRKTNLKFSAPRWSARAVFRFARC